MIGFEAEDNEPIKEFFGDLWKFSWCCIADYGTFCNLCRQLKYHDDMDARKLTTIFADQKEELLSHDLSLLCDRMEEGQLSPSSNLAQIVIGVRRRP